MRRTNVWTALLLLALVMTGLKTLPALGQTASVPEDKLALGDNEVRQLLLLMDTDQNGKISKEEWMNYMSAEFDKLDTDKSGELDAKELRLSSLRASHPSSTLGK